MRLKVKAMLRSIGVLFAATVITGFFSVCAIIFDLVSPNQTRIHRIAQLWADELLRLFGAKIVVLGRDNIIVNSPVIFMSNHQGLFDILALYRAVPVQFRWIIKKELFAIPLFGRAIKNAGYIKLDRKNRENAIKDVEIAAQKIRGGTSIMTFPEGTRCVDGRIGEFKRGMFHLALQTGVPIIPITIVGAFEILNRLTAGVGEGRVVTVIIGEPIETASYSTEMSGELIARVRQAVVANYDKYTHY
ncbi:MAG: 1-acyl-sn-glycerol-3-phosphate acyltransferase [Deltaproteobacteria bacterium]|nr:1-acyl-sn-glycerol-3-phosphate acyltransferase [Deltaproteobacteria bacterium]